MTLIHKWLGSPWIPCCNENKMFSKAGPHPSEQLYSPVSLLFKTFTDSNFRRANSSWISSKLKQNMLDMDLCLGPKRSNKCLAWRKLESRQVVDRTLPAEPAHLSWGCLSNSWLPLRHTQPVGANEAKWPGGFLMRLSGNKNEWSKIFLWPKQI